MGTTQQLKELARLHLIKYDKSASRGGAGWREATLMVPIRNTHDTCLGEISAYTFSENERKAKAGFVQASARLADKGYGTR